MNRRIFLVAGLLVPAVSSPRQVTASDACCAKLPELPYSLLLPGAVHTVPLTPNSPQLQFPTGPSGAYGIELDPKQQVVFIEFLTKRVGFTVFTASVLVPSFEFLDSAHEHIATAEPRIYQGGRRLGGLYQDYYGAVSVPPESKYVIVFTNHAKNGTEKIKLVQGGGLSAAYAISEDEDYYARMDRRDFAEARVIPPSDRKKVMHHMIDRADTGELKLKLVVSSGAI